MKKYRIDRSLKLYRQSEVEEMVQEKGWEYVDEPEHYWLDSGVGNLDTIEAGGVVWIGTEDEINSIAEEEGELI